MKLHYNVFKTKVLWKNMVYNCFIRRLFIGFLLLMMVTILSCRKYLDIDPPQNQLVEPTVFANNDNANAAILNVFAQMIFGNSSPEDISFYTGISGDELTSYNSVFNDFYKNNIQTNNGSLGQLWNLAYNYIYQVNAVNEGCLRSQSLDPEVKKQIIGEALFLRAYWHFYLYNLFGDIPIVTTTDYSINATLVRRSKNEIYSQIIKDLILASTNLNEKYVNETGLGITEERIRPNKYAAIALLARVYLYNREYTKAEEEASIVINNSSFYELEGLELVFLANSREAIWQLKTTTPNVNQNTPDGFRYILSSSPVNSGSQSLSPQLVNAFEAKDQRKIFWVGLYTDKTVVPNKDYYYPFKYKIKTDPIPKEYSMVLRLAELYLIRAEARAEEGKSLEAINDLDMIRKRAGLTLVKDFNSAISKENLLNAILKERQVELFIEQGHRWFDLKRTAKVDDVMNVVTITKGGIWNTQRQLWPIPRTELLNNSKLNQNPGYN